MTMTRLTTSASTGRRTKMSVNDFIYVGRAAPFFFSRLRWSGRDFRFWCEFVIDHDRHPISQFENARAHNDFTRLQSLSHRDKITARFSCADKLLPDHFRFLAALRILFLFNYKN